MEISRTEDDGNLLPAVIKPCLRIDSQNYSSIASHSDDCCPHGMKGIDPVHIHILVYRTLAVINYTNEFEVW